MYRFPAPSIPSIGDTALERSTNLSIKVYSLVHARDESYDELYARMFLTQTPRVLFAPHYGQNFSIASNDLDPGPRICEMDDEFLVEGRRMVEGVLVKAVNLWIRMISITRAELGPNRYLAGTAPAAAAAGVAGISPRGGGESSSEKMISFVFTEDGRVGVWKCERNKHRARLSQEAEGMLINAARELLSSLSLLPTLHFHPSALPF